MGRGWGAWEKTWPDEVEKDVKAFDITRLAAAGDTGAGVARYGDGRGPDLHGPMEGRRGRKGGSP